MFIEPDGYLSLIMVRSPQRRKGLGAAMLRYAKRLYPHIYAIPIGEESEKLFAEHHIPAAPLSTNRPELCTAALSSLMINKKCCLSQAYYRCPIYLIETK